MQGLLTVESVDDWARLRNLTTVLDPTVLHVADLFFGGCGLTPAARDRAWRTIEANAGALMTFVDAVLLWDEIPVFVSRFGARRLPERGPLADVFRPVLVTGGEYRRCRDQAVAGTEHVRGQAAYGSLLFDAYAQRLSKACGVQAQRVLGPQPSGVPAPGATAFPAAPTFLPLLLQEDDILTPEHLADRLMLWRTTDAVRDYRAWMLRLRLALARGQAPDGLAPDLAEIARRTGNYLAVEAGLDVLTVPGGSFQRLRYRSAASQRGLLPRLSRVWCG